MNVLDLFSGIGGFSLGLERAGMRTIAFCEIEPFCRKILRKHWPDVPIFEDVRKLHGWSMRKHTGICCQWSCALRNNKELVLSTSRLLTMFSGREEETSGALIAIKKCPYLQVVLSLKNSAAGGAESNTCVGKMRQTQTAESGCVATGIQTGKEGGQQEEKESTEAMSVNRRNGGVEYLQEIITLANNVFANQKKETISERIILKNGLISPNLDMKSAMEELYAKNVTVSFTCHEKCKRISVVTAGFPCQPASVAGKRRGTEDDRWLWPEVIRVVREFYPEWGIFENVPGLLALDGGVVFDTVLSDLEREGYAAWPLVIPACALNAPHRRDRVWVLAHASGTGRQECDAATEPSDKGYAAGRGAEAFVDDTDNKRELQQKRSEQESWRWACYGHSEVVAGASCELSYRAGCIRKARWDEFADSGGDGRIWIQTTESPVCGPDDGIPDRVARLKALGNAVVPQIPELIGRAIMATA